MVCADGRVLRADGRVLPEHAIVVRYLIHMPQNHVCHPWEHAVVACDRADAPGDRANVVSKNNDFAAELAGVISEIDSGHLSLVNLAQAHMMIELSLVAILLRPIQAIHLRELLHEQQLNGFLAQDFDVLCAFVVRRRAQR